MMRNNIIIFSFLYSGLWVSTLLLYFSTSYNIVYFFFYESILVFFFFISMKNKLGFLLALSSFIYFYQVPLMEFFPHEKLGVYDFNLNLDMQFEAYSIYNVVLGSLYVLINYIIKRIDFQKIIRNINKSNLINYLFFSSLSLAIIGILVTLENAGGLSTYLTLNKFDASLIQKMFFFTFKDFAIILLVIGMISKNKSITYLTYILIVFFISFEILSAKRLLVLIIAVNFLLYKIDKIKIKYFIYIYISVFLMTLSKFIYYNIRLYVVGEASFLDIFWFNWIDVFIDSIFIHEGRAHIELLLNYLYYDISFDPIYLIKQLLVSLPFGHKIIDDYTTAGEFLRLYLNEPWSGLASSQYIIPYLSNGFLGIIIIYAIHLLILMLFNYLIVKKNTLYFKLLFLVNIPILLFYSNREEIIVITKNIIISSIALLLIFMLARIFQLVVTIITKRKIIAN